MVKLNKIYTRTGDDGSTGLVDGSCRMKDDVRLAACGAVDEINAAIGMARLSVANAGKLDAMLMRIQNDLFDLVADLATPEKGNEPPGSALRMADAQVKRLENEMDGLNSALEALQSFVLPGGSPGAACLHLARTTARRAKRAVVALQRREKLNPIALCYLNRLSDFLFIAARFANDRGQKDVLWVPGAHRTGEDE